MFGILGLRSPWSEIPNSRWHLERSISCDADGTKAGVAEQVKNSVGRGTKTMTLHEARQILGIREEASWEEIVKVSGRCTEHLLRPFWCVQRWRCLAFIEKKLSSGMESLQGIRVPEFAGSVFDCANSVEHVLFKRESLLFFLIFDLPG
jgi:hypothetical protein